VTDVIAESGAPPTSATSPCCCALAVGIPLTKEDFLADAGDPDQEFVRRVILPQCQSHGHPAAVWDSHYRHEVDRLRPLLDDVSAQGVTVVDRASITDVSRMLHRFRVVSVLAHGWFPLMRESDVVDARRILDAVRAAPVLLENDAGFGARLVNELLNVQEMREVRRIGDFIAICNDLISNSRRFYRRHEQVAEPTPGIAFDGRMRIRWSMALLYEAFPSAIKAPRVIELRSGPVDLTQLIDAIPQAYTGTIENLICSAHWYSGTLRRRRPPLEAILSPTKLAHAVSRMTLYKWVIRLLAQRSIAYVDAVQAIHHRAGD
jgi:hypothetical protein